MALCSKDLPVPCASTIFHQATTFVKDFCAGRLIVVRIIFRPKAPALAYSIGYVRRVLLSEVHETFARFQRGLSASLNISAKFTSRPSASVKIHRS
jgi:hypothetical protein